MKNKDFARGVEDQHVLAILDATSPFILVAAAVILECEVICSGIFLGWGGSLFYSCLVGRCGR